MENKAEDQKREEDIWKCMRKNTRERVENRSQQQLVLQFQKREIEKRSSRYLFPWPPGEKFQQDG